MTAAFSHVVVPHQAQSGDGGSGGGGAPQAHFGQDAVQSVWDSTTQAVAPQLSWGVPNELAQQMQSLAHRVSELTSTGIGGAPDTAAAVAGRNCV